MSDLCERITDVLCEAMPETEWWFCATAAAAVIADLGMTEFRVEYPVPERWWATRVEPIEPIYG